MLGDFQYCSSSSDTESNDESDDSSKSEDCLDKLVQEKQQLEAHIKNLDRKMKNIQKTLRSLNEERKSLLTVQNTIISSLCVDRETTSSFNCPYSAAVTTPIQFDQASLSTNKSEVESLTNINDSIIMTNLQPLELSVPDCNKPNYEEFDSDDEQPL